MINTKYYYLLIRDNCTVVVVLLLLMRHQIGQRGGLSGGGGTYVALYMTIGGTTCGLGQGVFAGHLVRAARVAVFCCFLLDVAHQAAVDSTR